MNRRPHNVVLSFPRQVDLAFAGLKEAKNRREGGLGPSQIQLTSRFAATSTACREQNLSAQLYPGSVIAASNVRASKTGTNDASLPHEDSISALLLVH